ncbi:AAA family ATPase [Nonomuraea sp. NPDC050310]|uniref:helix-turn-helix transcriptional regulator n=1 Tax=unclassified Nonomuraea TaxID=2593643 RepID=UPI00341082EF
MSVHTVSPLFVGRVKELSALERALDGARAGSSSIVLVGGEAGVGKTRLIKEFTARADGFRVLVGGCLELGTEGLPYAPFTAVLRALVRELGREAVTALVTGGTQGLARLLPEFGEPGSDGAEARARLFEQVLGLLERLAEEAPLALVVEDAHWADRSTRDLLSFLVRYLRPDTRLVIVVTYRSDELHRTHPLRPLLAELGRVAWVSRLELRRLTRREVVEQAVGILERKPSKAAIDLIYSRSEGNPLFVEALLNEASGGEALPESLRDLLLASVQRLPDETQELLRVASAGGARIEHDLLAVVAGLDDAAFSAALRPAVAGNVLVVDGEGYAFRHALIREALHEDLLPGERTRLHTRFAEALDRDLSILPAPRGAIELAHHWHAAHDTTWALISAWHAAAAARASAAYDEQLGMLSRVLELWDQVPDAAERIGADHIDVLRDAVVVSRLTGESERGIALATAALAENPEPERASRLLTYRGLMRDELGRAGARDDLRAGAALVPAGRPSRLRARALHSLAATLNTPDVRQEKLAVTREAIEIAHQVGDRVTEANALVTLTWTETRYADVDAHLDGFHRASRLAREAGAEYAVMRSFISESDVLEGAGRHDDAARVARQGVADAEAHGLARASGTFLAINLAEPLVSLGRWDEALEVIEHALDLAPPAPTQASLQGWITDIALARGDLARAESHFLAARRVFSRGSFRDQTVLPHARREFALAAARGELDVALAVASRAVRELDPEDSPRYAWPMLVEFGWLPEALPEEVLALGRRLSVDGASQEAQRLTFFAQTGLTAVDGAAFPEGRVAVWGAAAAAWRGLGVPYGEARALLGGVKAALAARSGGSGAGRVESAEAAKELGEQLEAARGLAVRLGAKPLVSEIDAVARKARLAVGGGASAGQELRGEQDQRAGLTARELEVLQLLTEGSSNREIGARLFISVKTVSVHVSNILAKLGVASRGEAAATAHKLGLFEETAG